MPEVLLSIGSNIHREVHIRSCMRVLESEFGRLDVSPVYESESVGFDGENFFNLVVSIETSLGVASLSSKLREIENTHGRDRSSPKFSARTLDIDILTYGEKYGMLDGVELPRAEILKNAFVLKPLADLRPDCYYPGSANSYKLLWDSFSDKSQKLWLADIEL
ncbi:2-amino-4-hydroxy-6-hydroxymethyldihydropteridinediphosphokinase [Alteromonadaceae bacterium Bs31]|nr:2-amino-4-hydroxy-6-hydroxymethyldihydropteridinediphosphokinase [Alteromonadaceae bacterium Bs31]